LKTLVKFYDSIWWVYYTLLLLSFYCVCLKNPSTNRTSCVSVQGAEPGLQAGLLQAVAESDKGRLERHRALQ